MSIQLHKIHKNAGLRRALLPVLKAICPGDIRCRHHYTGQRYKLNSWRHKGYWYHGKRREPETMEFFKLAIKPGDTVIELGGHIGYISMYLAHLVGENGFVYVFEPGANNKPYIEANLANLKNVELLDFAVSDTDGVASFFEEELTGQNNSLNSDYEVFSKNLEDSFSDQNYSVREVQTVRLDSFVEEREISPHLIKIDVEGAELQVLHGARQTLATHLPAVLFEATKDRAESHEFLNELGYVLHNEYGLPADPERGTSNITALHPDRHADLIERVAKPVNRE